MDETLEIMHVNIVNAVAAKISGKAISNGNITNFINVDSTEFQTKRNDSIQFDISNPMYTDVRTGSMVGVAGKLRIGSMVGIAEGFKMFQGLINNPSGCDTEALTLMSDGLGKNYVPGVQGFSTITCHKPIVFDELRIVTPIGSPQLSITPTYCILNPDGTITSYNINLISTYAMSDMRQNMTILKSNNYNGWFIDSMRYFEIPIVASNQSFLSQCSIILHISDINDAIPMMKFN